MDFNNIKHLNKGTLINIAAVLAGSIILLCIGIFILSAKDDNGNNDQKTEFSGYSKAENDSSKDSETQNTSTSPTTTTKVQSETDSQTKDTSSSNTEQTTTVKITETTENKTTQKDTTTENQTTKPIITYPPETPDEKVERILAGLTLEEKVYQMFILAPEHLTGVNSVTQAGNITKNAIQQYPVGGLIYFSNNILNENQLTTMLANTQKYSMERCGLKMFLCIDEEGGRVARIGNNSSFNVEKFPDMASIDSEAKAYHVGETIGTYLSKYGFNVDFAPDADVITEPSNTVIGKRSFGTDPSVVSKMALAVAKGLNSKGVMSTYKHFPGHGATVGDTHEGFAYTEKTEAQLMQSELIPFLDAAKSGYVDMVMIAHISVPNIVGDNTPSSLSYKIVTGILKEKLGYKGLIVTDALNMGAIANNYTSANAAILAVKAGNDLLLMPKDFKEASQAIIQAVRNGEISEERINESVRKIIKAKLNL